MEQELLKYLKTYRLMALATYGETPWICWVFYVVDEKFNIYFISSPKTQHAIDIASNNKVACAISDTTQNPLGDKKGVQIWGTVEEVTLKEKLQTFFEMWKNTINNNEQKLTYKNYADKVLDSKVYKIVPKKIKWFNQELKDGSFIIEK